MTLTGSGQVLRAIVCASLTLLATRSAGQVKVTDNVQDEGQSCFKVETSVATYFFQKKAAGFSSIVDKKGNDWVSYKKGGGSGGEYRGIPNLGGCCHPGYPTSNEGVAMTSTLAANTATKATIVSSSGDNKWETKWDFYATHATLTVEKAGAKYWVLYEGTPGGAWNKNDDFLIHSDGTKKLGKSADFSKDLADPEWVYFGDGPSGLGLLYVHHTDDKISDTFWSFGDMTVFGFGRTCKGSCFGLTATNNMFSIAITDKADYASIKTLATSLAKGTATPTMVPRAARTGSAAKSLTYGNGFQFHDLAGRRVAMSAQGTGPVTAGTGVLIATSRDGHIRNIGVRTAGIRQQQ